MSAVTDITLSDQEAQRFEPYRAVSRAAVIALCLAGIGLFPLALALFAFCYAYGDAVPSGTFAAILGLATTVFGLLGLVSIYRYPQEYTGLRMAQAASLLGLVQLAGGTGMAVYTYAHEVPEGYVRTGFGELQPDPDYPEYFPISPKAAELAGKPIFIKGYMHPGVASRGKVNRFILVPDMGTCCFGGDPKTSDMIEVFVPDESQRLAYSKTRIKLAGEFAVSQHPSNNLGMKNAVLYHLKVDQVR